MDKNLDTHEAIKHTVNTITPNSNSLIHSTYPSVALNLNKLLLFFFLIVVSLTSSQQAIAANGHKILIYGDSLSAAYNIRASKSWVTLVDQSLQAQFNAITIVNASISGETSAGGLRRLRDTLAQQQPDIMLLELGANDGLRGMPLHLTKKNLSAMIQLAQDNQIIVILAGMQLPPNYGPLYTNQFKQLYTALSDTHQLSLIPFLLDGIADKDEYKLDDGLHPNEKAQPIIAKTVLPYLVKAIKTLN